MTLLTGALLAAGFLMTGCGSTRCQGGGGDAQNLAGGSASWCEWEVLDRSGKEPNWKKAVDSANLEFCGEGVGQTEAEAREKAEDNMRTQAARYLNTNVNSIMVLRETGNSESYGGQHQTTTDVNVKQMAVSNFYWEKRRRTGYQHDVEIKQQGYRVLVIGSLKKG